jgi:NAD-dependent dihydropyrimidine dehydrogenase PreA subunit
MHEPVVGGIVFNPELCNGCGSCVESCKAHAWTMSPARNSRGTYPAQHVSHKCHTCGTCYYFCPQLGAIKVSQIRKAPARETRQVHAA